MYLTNLLYKAASTHTVIKIAPDGNGLVVRLH